MLLVFSSVWVWRAWFFDRPLGEVFTVLWNTTTSDRPVEKDFVRCGTVFIEPMWSTNSWNGSDPLGKPWSSTQYASVDQIPLKYTSVESHIAWFVSRTYVTQVFENTADVPVEATYMFPLPNEAAVDHMEMKIWERVVEWTIEKKAVAEQRYQQTKQQWKTAALLNQNRPNLFTQKVANVMPGDRIEVTISYFQSIAYEDGEYTYVFPMVVGPRYIPSGVKDAWSITSPTIPAHRAGHDIDVTVHIDGWIPIQSLTSSSHDISVTRVSDSAVTVILKNEWEIPNRDLSIGYVLATNEKEVWVLFHHGATDDHGYMALMVEPPVQPHQDEIIGKEVIFVLDTSGSMNGRPIASVKKAMTKAITNLNEWDTFNIIDFDSSVTTFFDTAQPASDRNIKRGLNYVQWLKAWWGTVMDRPLEQALEKSWGDQGRVRTILVMTDGDIGNEKQILNLISKQLWENRIFVFGVDAAANRYLLDRMAEVWRWRATYILNDAEIQEKVDLFYDSFKSPLLTNITIDRWQVRVYDALPTYLSDLYAWQPIRLIAKYDTQWVPENVTVTIKWWQWNQPYIQEIPVRFPSLATQNDSLKSLRWRQQVKELYTLNRFENNISLEQDITELGLTYSIMTEYTSFLAIDDRIRNPWGDQVVVDIPKYQVSGKNEVAQERQWSPSAYESQADAIVYKWVYQQGLNVWDSEKMSNLSNLSMVWTGVWQQDSSVSVIQSILNWLYGIVAVLWGMMIVVWWRKSYRLKKQSNLESTKDDLWVMSARYIGAKKLLRRWLWVVLCATIVWFIAKIMLTVVLI